MEQMDDDQQNENKPLRHGCYDNWTWSKRHRSQEVVFTDSTLRKGKRFFPLYSQTKIHKSFIKVMNKTDTKSLASIYKTCIFVKHFSILSSQLVERDSGGSRKHRNQQQSTLLGNSCFTSRFWHKVPL